MLFKRYCIRCFKEYRPEGRSQRLCVDCRKKVQNENFIKMLSFRKIKKRDIRR